MQAKLDLSDLILLLPKDYERVWNGKEIYRDMYHDRNYHDVQMYQNLASESVGNILISHIDQADAMPFGDKDALIKELHDTMGDDQGLIEVECGTNPRGYEYIYSIIKTYHQEQLNVNYCMRMDIRNDEELIEVSASFFENRMTGQRGSFAWAMARNAGIEDDPETHFPKGWFQDPYDPGYEKGCLMTLGERRGFDGLFPGEPLSQARELVLALTEDSYYKTRAEIEEESEEKKKEEKRAERTARREARRKRKEEGEETVADNTDPAPETEESDSAEKDDKEDFLKKLFSNDVTRAGEYKVDIIGADSNDDKYEEPEKKRFSFKPAALAEAAAKVTGDAMSAVRKTSTELNKVNVPFDVPYDFRNKLNQSIKEMPGWGKRKYVGFGKSTYGMSAVLITWPVLESESMSLTDEDSIIANIRTEHVDNQGLIDVKCGVTPKGNRYAYIIRKLYYTDEEGNRTSPTQYTLGLNIRIDGKIHFIDSFFGPSEEFGNTRGAALEIMKCGSKDLKLTPDEWQHDPFDADIKEGFLMDWTEDKKYDDLFPYSPLSELRDFVKYVTENN